MGRGGEQGKQVLRSQPGAGRIVYDNGGPNYLTGWVLAQFNKFCREEQFRIAQGQFRIAQGEIMSASGVSISIALIEGGGV